ncbi:MAG: hypothetical protein ACRCSV_04870 [Chlamydiales bacterium]
MVEKSQLHELTVKTTIDTDNQPLTNNSKIEEVFVETIIDMGSCMKSSYSTIKFEPLKTGRPDDLHLYVHAQSPSMMREIQLKEGPNEDQVLLNVDKFLCNLQNSLYADYLRVNCSEGIIFYQSIGETEVKKIDVTKVEDGKYLSEFHKVQDALREVIDESEHVEYIERIPGLRGVDQTNQFSPPLTERFATLNQQIIPPLLERIKTEPEKVKFLEKVIFADCLVKNLLEESALNVKQAQWNLQEIQQTPSDSRFSQREHELQEATKDYEIIQQLDLVALYTIAAHIQNKDSKDHISASREIEKFLSSNLAIMGKKSWHHQESFLKKSISLLTLNRIWAKLQPLTEDESDYAYRMGALSLPAGDRILYKEYIEESGKEVADIPILQVLIEAMRSFPDNSLCECKGLLRATPYNFLGIEKSFQLSKEASLNASHSCITSDQLLEHIKAKSRS